MLNYKRILQSLRPFYLGLPIIIACTGLAIVIAERYLNYVTPMYESTAKIKLADASEGLGNSNLYKNLDVFVTSNKVAAEVELMKSKVIVERAVNKLDLSTIIYRVGDLHKTELYSQSPFILKAALADCKWADRPFALTIYSDSLFKLTLPDGELTGGTLNKMINTKCGPIFIILNRTLLLQKPYLKINDNYEFKIFSHQSIIENVSSNLDVSSVEKDVPILRISYKTPVAEKSADVVNAISASYISDYIEEKYRSADTASLFLDRQLKEFRDRLANNENAIENYRDDNNIINIRQETETELRKIADMQRQLASLEMNIAAADTLNDYIKRGKTNFLELAPNFEAYNDLLSTEMVKSIKLLQREKKDLLLRFTPEDEKVKIIDEKISDLSVYMIESIKNTAINLKTKHRDLENTIHEAEKAFIGLPTREKKMAILERNFTLNEQIYRFLHEKRAEAEIAKAATISFHRIISVGEIPRIPVSPNRTLIVALSSLLGFLIGIAIIYLILMVRGSVNNAHSLHKLTSIPLAQSVTKFTKPAEQQMFFHKWALELLLKGLLHDGAIITLSSFGVKEGKRLMAVNLAQALQRIGKKVLLVDADGSIKKYAATDYFNLQESACKWYQPEGWQELIKKWKGEYDVIVLKNFAVDEDPNALLLMSHVEYNLVVLDSVLTKRTRIEEVEAMQDELHIAHLELVLNRADYSPGLYAQVKTFVQNKRGKKSV